MVHGNIAVGVCPTTLVMWNVGIDDIKDHIGNGVIEVLCNTALGTCKSIMVTCKIEPITELGLGDGLWARCRAGEGQR